MINYLRRALLFHLHVKHTSGQNMSQSWMISTVMLLGGQFMNFTTGVSILHQN
jgi:hypothetical protein